MSNGIGYEVDFLPVGNGERSGDAIAVRFGTLGSYKVLVYDGGTKESGQSLVNHIKEYYQTTRVDYLVNSHPDSDHATGLSVVMEQLTVGEMWMHRPWNYSTLILDYFKDGRLTGNSLEEQLKERLAPAYELEQLARRKKISINEPFLGSRIGPFIVLSPEKEWYVHELIASFEKSPEEEELSLKKLAFKALQEAGKRAVVWVAENWGIESLREDVETTAENESSVVLYGAFEDHRVLLTGDAGIKALKLTADVAHAYNISVPIAPDCIQVPHHGSRHNISSTVLDRVVGPRKAVDNGVTTKDAVVSVSKGSTTHPRKSVVNAFLRRGVRVVATKGRPIWCHNNMPLRVDWEPAVGIPFSAQVEPWD